MATLNSLYGTFDPTSVKDALSPIGGALLAVTDLDCPSMNDPLFAGIEAAADFEMFAVITEDLEFDPVIEALIDEPSEQLAA